MTARPTATSVLERERQRTKMYLANPGIDPSAGCWSKSRLADDRACPNRANHLYGPAGYVAWHAWVDEIARRLLRQSKCECGYWMLAVAKPEPIRATP